MNSTSRMTDRVDVVRWMGVQMDGELDFLLCHATLGGAKRSNSDLPDQIFLSQALVVKYKAHCIGTQNKGQIMSEKQGI